jgi:hypothetical protein
VLILPGNKNRTTALYTVKKKIHAPYRLVQDMNPSIDNIYGDGILWTTIENVVARPINSVDFPHAWTRKRLQKRMLSIQDLEELRHHTT